MLTVVSSGVHDLLLLNGVSLVMSPLKILANISHYLENGT